MWSKIEQKYIENYDPRLIYHNGNHIQDCYDYLEQSGYPYSEQLDLAVKYHDWVYDEYPDKEMRSAVELLKVYPNAQVASKIILVTTHHSFDANTTADEKAMVRADLHGFTDPETTLRNYDKIMDESKNLYGVTAKQFAEENFKFLKGLEERVQHNTLFDPDTYYWKGVMAGIQYTMDLSMSFHQELCEKEARWG